MKVTTEIIPSKIDGVDRAIGDKSRVNINNVDGYQKLVEIEIYLENQTTLKVSVIKSELLKAIQNATDNP